MSGILQKLFIVFLLVTFAVTAGSFILRNSISGKLERLTAQLEQPSQQLDIGATLLDLSVAENEFQKASEGGKEEDLAAYKSQLKSIFDQVAVILHKYQADSSRYFPGSKQQIALAVQRKVAVSQHLFELKRHFDSLLKVTTLSAIDATGKLNKPVDPLVLTRNNPADTVVATRVESNKNGLLKRLKDAISNKNSVKVLTIKEKQDKATLLRMRRQNEKDLLRQLNKQYGSILQSNQKLISANLNLLNELHQLLTDLQDIENIAYQKARETTLREYQQTTRDLNTFTAIASVLLLVFVPLLIVYIRKATATERNYQLENRRAVTLASEKSEILAIVSHEIRNKLMAITGAIFMLNRTKMLPEQEQKVASINLSSGLLMETVNNILDASKMERKAPETLREEIFEPFKEISNSIDAMRFMAENKGLEINASFSDPVDVQVVGDSFRLKQIVINLLSNAIKYTDNGRIVVTAELTESNGRVQLDAEVADTGAGISAKNQGMLFNPYYQVSGSKPGTGLGLYLCKQLVTLQQGKITLNSQEGKGTSVRFTIPYKTSG